MRERERQVTALLFERLTLNNPDRVLELARQGQQVSTPGDVLKDPLVLELAGTRDNPALQERDLEQAFIDRLEGFLLEMGASALSHGKSGSRSRAIRLRARLLAQRLTAG